MASRTLLAVLCALAVRDASAQTQPQRVNATAKDGSIVVEWLIPTADNNLKSFEGASSSRACASEGAQS